MIFELSYQLYKDHVEEKIQQKVTRDLINEKNTKTKLRHIDPGKHQNYVDQCSIMEASLIMKIRLHMICAKGNYGGGVCRECHDQEETTELKRN